MDPRTLIDLSYCPQTIDKNLDKLVLNLLQQLNDKDATKPVFSLNWVLRRIAKIEVIVLPPTVTLSDDIPLRVRRNLSRGSHLLFAKCAENKIPIVYALDKGVLSKLLRGGKEKNENDWHDLYPVGITAAGIKAAGVENEVKKVTAKARELAKDWEEGWEEEYDMACISCKKTFDRGDLCCGCLIDEKHVYCEDCIRPNNWEKGCPTCISYPRREFDGKKPEGAKSSKKPREKKDGFGKRKFEESDHEEEEEEDDGEYKWKMCRVFLKLGECPYNEFCQYRHGEDDERERPTLKPEDWTAPKIKYQKKVHPACKKIFAAMLKEFQEKRAEAATDEEEEQEKIPDDVLVYRDCRVTYGDDNKVTIVGRSLKWTEIAFYKLRDDFVRRIEAVSSGTASNTYVVVTGNEPFRFSGRKRNKLLRLKGTRGESEGVGKVTPKDGTITFTDSAVDAENAIGELLQGCKSKYGELRLGLGYNRFTLEHENFVVVEEEEDVEEEAEEGEDKKVKSHIKEWSLKELQQWKLGTDFDLRFNSYWLPAQADSYKSVLKIRGFDPQPYDDLLEITCLSEGEWKCVWFKWHPIKEEPVEAEAEEEEGEDEDKPKPRKIERGVWQATEPLGEVSAAAEGDSLVYFLNLASSIDKDAVFVVSPRREPAKSTVEESLSKLLNPADSDNKPTPASLNSRILDQSNVFIKDFRVIRKQRFNSPDGQFSVEFHSVKRKGIAVSFVWNKPLMNLNKDQVITVLRFAREWLYQTKLLGTIDDLRQKNRMLVQQVKGEKKSMSQKERGPRSSSKKKKQTRKR